MYEYKAVKNLAESIKDEKELAVAFKAIKAASDDLLSDEHHVFDQLDQMLIIIGEKLSETITSDSND